MVRGSNCESLIPTRGSDRIVTCLAIHSPNSQCNVIYRRRVSFKYKEYYHNEYVLTSFYQHD